MKAFLSFIVLLAGISGIFAQDISSISRRSFYSVAETPAPKAGSVSSRLRKSTQKVDRLSGQKVDSIITTNTENNSRVVSVYSYPDAYGSYVVTEYNLSIDPPSRLLTNKWITQYDAAGNLILNEMYACVNQCLSLWNNCYSARYDESGKLISEKWYEGGVEPNSVCIKQQLDYVYNNDRVTVSEYSYDWNTLTTTKSAVHTIHLQNPEVEDIFCYDSVSHLFNNHTAHILHYKNVHRQDSLIITYHTEPENYFTDSVTFSYNNQNQLVSNQHFKKYSGWELDYSTTNNYNSKYKILSSELKYEKGPGMYNSREEYEYNATDTLLLRVCSWRDVYNTNSWKKELLNEYAYDQSGNMLYSYTYYLNGANWDLLTTGHYYYPLKTDTGIIKTERRMIYPNPSSEIIHINGQGGDATVRFYDMDGKLIRNVHVYGSEPIIISTMKSGTYCVKIDSDTQHSMHKFVKQ